MAHPQIELTHAREELETLLRCAAGAERRAENLIKQYGTGCRPSWVSGEVSHEWTSYRRYMDAAEKQQKIIEDLKKRLRPE